MVINMNSHKSGVCNIQTKRKNSLLIFQMVIVLALAAHWVAMTSRAQSPTAQKQNSPTPAETEPVDLINADRPGIADGSTVIGSHRLQIGSGLQEEFRRDGDSHEHTLFFPTLLRIGIDNYWEARIEGNTFTIVSAFAAADVTHQTSGLAPVSLGLKYQFMDSDGWHHPSLGTIVRVFPAWGKETFAPTT